VYPATPAAEVAAKLVRYVRGRQGLGIIEATHEGALNSAIVFAGYLAGDGFASGVGPLTRPLQLPHRLNVRVDNLTVLRFNVADVPDASEHGGEP